MQTETPEGSAHGQMASDGMMLSAEEGAAMHRRRSSRQRDRSCARRDPALRLACRVADGSGNGSRVRRAKGPRRPRPASLPAVRRRPRQRSPSRSSSPRARSLVARRRPWCLPTPGRSGQGTRQGTAAAVLSRSRAGPVRVSLRPSCSRPAGRPSASETASRSSRYCRRLRRRPPPNPGSDGTPPEPGPVAARPATARPARPRERRGAPRPSVARPRRRRRPWRPRPPRQSGSCPVP